MKLRLSILSAIFGINCYAQAPETEWQNTYGGSGKESSEKGIPTSDGGYIAVSTTTSVDGDLAGLDGSGNIWVVKLNSAGEIIWSDIYGGSGGEFGRDIIQTTDGGYMVTGQSASNDGDVTGAHGSADVWLLKLDDSGNIEWQKTYGGSGFDEAWNVKQTNDGGYVFLAWSNSTDGDLDSSNRGDFDLWIVKTNATGDIIWKKTYGGSDKEFADEIYQTADGGYIVSSWTYSHDGDVNDNHSDSSNDIWILKLDENGDIVWKRCYGGSSVDIFSSIQPTSDGGYVFTAVTGSTNGDLEGVNESSDDHIWTAKIDGAGVIQWQVVHGGMGINRVPIIRIAPNSGYYHFFQAEPYGSVEVPGAGEAGMLLYKIDESGVIQWQTIFGGEFYDNAGSLEVTPDGGVLIGGGLGTTTSNVGPSDMFIAKLAPDNMGVEINKEILFTVYPNPSSSEIRVATKREITINAMTCRDISGKTVAMSKNSDILYIQDIATGIYTVEIQSGKEIYFTKFIKN